VGGLSGTGTVKGEDVDDSATFSTKADFDGRTRTTASVDIDTITAEDALWYSYDIKTIIQEIVNRAGWATGQDMAD
jgi:hypothetical protein